MSNNNPSNQASIHDNPYGVGIAYRYHLHDEIVHYADDIDLLEIPTEDHIIRRRALSYPNSVEKFDYVSQAFPCVGHGISLSIGSVEAFDQFYLESTKKFMENTGIHTFSEHLAFHTMDGTDLTVFLPLPFDDLSADWLAQRYNYVRDYIGRPLALENVSLYFQVPESQYTEPQFLAAFLERTDATLLFDVTNVYNNCTNHNQDPIEYLHTLPADRISQLHLAGGHFEEGFLLDSHSYPVMEEVWDLYEETLKYTTANIVILERDYNCFPFRDVMKDMRRAREIFYRHRPETAPEAPAINATAPATSEPDFNDPRFADLRGFQRALMKEITDDEFRSSFRDNAESAIGPFPMSSDWLNRLQECEKIDFLARMWKFIDEENKQDLERFKRWEWSQFLQT